MGKVQKQQSAKGPGAARAVAWPSSAIAAWQRDRIAAAGGDPSIVPETPFKFLRLSDVKELTGLSRSTIYRLAGEQRFPAPVPLCTTVEQKAAR
jgi:predicted DNA-binding transcriptional regulator AlpA